MFAEQKINSMKSNKIFLVIALSGALLSGCGKESDVADSGAVSQPYVATVIKFTAGDRNYEMRSVRQETAESTSGPCAGANCGNPVNKDVTDDWNSFSAGNLLTVTRQDDAAAPAFRLSLLGTIDLRNTAFPAEVANARIFLNDFNGALRQPSDDPAYSTGALTFEGSRDAVRLIVSSRSGNVVSGTFEGTLTMSGGSTLAVSNGTFTAQLIGL